MGKRSRNRTGGPGSERRPSRRPASRAKAEPSGRKRLDPVRRTLAGYLAAAAVLSVLTLVGIVVLGGSLGPFIVLAVVVVAAGLISRAATGRLVGAELNDEDRVVQTMAGGLLVICAILSLSSVVLTLLA